MKPFAVISWRLPLIYFSQSEKFLAVYLTSDITLPMASSQASMSNIYVASK